MITSVENDRKQEFEKEVALRKEMEVSTPGSVLAAEMLAYSSSQ